MTLIGLGAASLAILVVGFGPSPVTAPAALTVPIPDKPVAGGSADGATSSGIASSDDEENGSALPEHRDPIAAMIAYVTERPLAVVDRTDAGPLLRKTGTVDGLTQFTRAADAVGLERLLQPNQAYTIFAPSDAAFADLAPGDIDRLLAPSGHERLLTLLSRHIVPGRLTSDDIIGRVRTVQSLAGQPVTIDGNEDIRIGDAGTVETDLQLENGALHVIDKLLSKPEP